MASKIWSLTELMNTEEGEFDTSRAFSISLSEEETKTLAKVYYLSEYQQISIKEHEFEQRKCAPLIKILKSLQEKGLLIFKQDHIEISDFGMNLILYLFPPYETYEGQEVVGAPPIKV